MLVQGVENISEIKEEFKAKVTHLQSYRTLEIQGASRPSF